MVRVRAEHTGGVMAVIEEIVPPGALITPHTHQNDVWVHVLAGQIGVLAGEQTASAAPGAWALKPRGVLHAMWNTQPAPAPDRRSDEQSQGRCTRRITVSGSPPQLRGRTPDADRAITWPGGMSHNRTRPRRTRS